MSFSPCVVSCVGYCLGMTPNDYSATIEYISHGRAIIELTDSLGQWAGGHKIEVRSGLKSDLYEAGYRAASAEAAIKGGRLGRYTEAA